MFSIVSVHVLLRSQTLRTLLDIVIQSLFRKRLNTVMKGWLVFCITLLAGFTMSQIYYYYFVMIKHYNLGRLECILYELKQLVT
jgi:hypothetical protein